MKNGELRNLAESAIGAAILSLGFAVLFIVGGASVAIVAQIWIICTVLFTVVILAQVEDNGEE